VSEWLAREGLLLDIGDAPREDQSGRKEKEVGAGQGNESKEKDTKNLHYHGDRKVFAKTTGKGMGMVGGG
jgi:hypothetical protein